MTTSYTRTSTLAAWLLAFALVLTLLTSCSVRPLSACPEDAVLVGQGGFENGYWTTYVCGPARDDYREDR